MAEMCQYPELGKSIVKQRQVHNCFPDTDNTQCHQSQITEGHYSSQEPKTRQISNPGFH